MIRILLLAVMLAVLPWLAPRPAHAQGDEQNSGGPRDTRGPGDGESVTVDGSAAGPIQGACRDDLPARVQGWLYPGR